MASPDADRIRDLGRVLISFCRQGTSDLAGLVRILQLSSFILLLAALSASSAFAQRWSDTVLMNNGDRITGEIQGLQDGVLYLKLDYVDGTISINWSKVARVESSRLFIINTEKGTPTEGMIATAEGRDPGPVKLDVIRTTGEHVQYVQKDVVHLDLSSRSFWRRLNGNVNLGMNFAKDNSSTQFNISSVVEYPRERWNARLSLDSNQSTNAGDVNSNRYEIRTRVNRDLRWRNYFVMAGMGFLQSSEQDISLQSNVAVGIGYLFKNSNRTKFSIVGGMGWQRTSYGEISEIPKQNVVVATVNAQVKFMQFKRTRLETEASFMPSVSDAGRLYFRLNQSYYVRLFGDLSWNLSLYGNWDSRPPAGLSGSDYGTSMGVGWTFGNK